MSATPAHGDLRVWWIPQIPGEMFTVDVPDRATAKLLLDVLADYDLFQLEQNIKPDYCNAGGIDEWDAAEDDWLSVDEEDAVRGIFERRTPNIGDRYAAHDGHLVTATHPHRTTCWVLIEIVEAA